MPGLMLGILPGTIFKIISKQVKHKTSYKYVKMENDLEVF